MMRLNKSSVAIITGLASFAILAAAFLSLPTAASAAWNCRLECTAAKRGISSFSCPGTPTEAVCGTSPNFTCYEGANDPCPDNFKMFCEQANCPVACDTDNYPCTGCAAATSTIGADCSPPAGGKYTNRCGACACPPGTVQCLSPNKCVTPTGCSPGYTFDACAEACITSHVLASPASPQSAYISVTGDVKSTTGDFYLAPSKAIHVDATSAVPTTLNFGNWYGGTSANDANLNVLGSVYARSGFGIGSVFSVNNAGDLAKIKNVSYSWPAASGSGVLTNNGAGGLSWASPTFGGSGDIELFNGQILTPFGGLGKAENWLNYSNSFDNAAWTKTGVSVSADSTAAPDFSLTADSIADDATAGGTAAQTSLAAASPGKTYTFSVWVKDNNTTSDISIRIMDNGTTPGSTTKTIDPPAGWQRFYVTHTASAGSTTLTPTISHSGGASTSFYAWGAQVELGSSPGVYFSTDSGSGTPVPRKGLYGRAGAELNGMVAAGYLSADGTFPSASTQGYSHGLYVRSMTGYTGAGGANTQKYGINVVQTNRFDTYANYALGAYNMSDDQFTAANGRKYGANISNSGVAHTEQTGGLLVTEYSTNSVSAGSKNGLRVEVSGAYDGGAAATTNYGIYLSNTATADTNYALYSASAYNSYFAGNVGIGTATITKKLDVAGTIQGTAADIGVIGNGTGAGGAGVAGYGTAANGKGVYGYGGSNGWGVYGETASGSSVGVLGISTSSAGGQFNTSTGYGAYIVATSTGTGLVVDSVSGYGALFRTGNVGIGNSAPASLLSVGSSSQFQINSSGNLTKINNVTYSWPGANAAGVLTSDASGNLSWAAAGGGVGGSGTANKVARFTAGTTIGDSIITASGTDVSITGTSGSSGLVVSNNGAGYGLYITANPPGNSMSTIRTINNGAGPGIEVNGGSAAYAALIRAGGNNAALDAAVYDHTSTNTLVNVLTIRRATSGTAAVGEGGAINWALKDTSGSHFNASAIGSVMTVTTPQSDLVFIPTGGVAGTEAMRIRYDGNVGIGTTSPGTKLDVNGTAKMTGFQLGTSTTAGYVLTANASGVGTWQAAAGGGGMGGSGTANYVPKFTAGTTLGNSLIQDNGTGVGINASPNASVKLYVAGGGIGLDNSQGIWAKSSGGSMSNLIYLDASDKMRIRGLAGGFQVDDSGGNSMVFVNNSGNMGIGTTAPVAKLNVEGSISLGSMNTATGTNAIAIGTRNDATAFTSVAIGGYTVASANGNIAIGGGIDVSNKLTNNVATSLGVGFNTTIPTFFVGPGTGAGTIGKVGIGTTTPSTTLDVNGTAKMTGFQLGSSATAGYVLTANASGVGTWQAAAGGGGGMGGSGTLNYVPKFTAGTTLGNSQIFDDGTNVGIGIATPNNKLQVAGLINFNNGVTGTFLGYQAGNVNTGTENTFVGYQAGVATTSGFTNLGVGKYALLSNTTGNFNTAIGYRTLQTSTIASRNTALGHRSLMTTTGEDNIGLGFQALMADTTGAQNVAVGTNPLFNNLTGSGNVAVGYQALYSTTAGNNTSLGYNAGLANTSGSSNTFIGSTADASSGTLTYATAIGAGAVVGQSNSVVLGRTTDNVGIGTTAPGTKLDVSGTVKMTGFQLGTSTTAGYVLTANASGVGTWQVAPAGGGGSLPAGANYQMLRHNGTTWVASSAIKADDTNVGIGLDPSFFGANAQKVTVWETTAAKDGMRVFSDTGDGAFIQSTSGDALSTHSIYGAGAYIQQGNPLTQNSNQPTLYVSRGYTLNGYNATAPVVRITDSTAATGDMLYVEKQSSGFFSIKNTGYVGIGTTSPAQKLDVAGTVKMTGFQLGSSATAGYVLTANASGVGTWQAAAGGGGGMGGSGTAGYHAKFTAGTTLGNGVIYDNGTNIGIGTTAPAARLHTAGANAAVRLHGVGSYTSGARLNFGDGEYVYVDEATDDKLSLYGSSGITLTTASSSYPITLSALPSGYAYHLCVSGASSGNIGICSSSRRYKEDIKDLDVSNWRDLFDLQPVAYRLTATGEFDIGLIAEDVAQVLPQLVFDKDGLPEGVKYEKLPLYLMAGLKEVDGEVTKLKTENAELKQRLGELEALVRNLTK